MNETTSSTENDGLPPNMNNTLSVIRDKIYNDIAQLDDNTLIFRKMIYDSYIRQFGEAFPDLCILIKKIEKPYLLEKYLSNSIIALAVVSTFSSIADVLLNISEGNIVYILLGLLLSFFCSILCYRVNLNKHLINLKIGFAIGLSIFLLGLWNYLFPQYNVMKSLQKNADMLFMKDSINSIKDSNIAIDAELRKLRISVLSIPLVGGNNLPLYVQDNGKGSGLNHENLNVDDKNEFTAKLTDNHCTIMIRSGYDEHQILSKSADLLSSNIFLHDDAINNGYYIISVASNTDNFSEVSGSLVVNGLFGKLQIDQTGEYKYTLSDFFAYKKYEGFRLKIRSPNGDIFSRRLYISIVGTDLVGSSVRDTMFGSDKKNIMYGKAGGDWLFGGKEDDYIDGGEGDDYINGRDGNDKIFGGPGNDIIYGGNGNDKIDAGSGDDEVISGKGQDTISGGLGADRFWFVSLDEGVDLITDFNLKEGDSIEISNLFSRAINEGVDIRELIYSTHNKNGLTIYARANKNLDFVPFVILSGFDGSLEDLIHYKSIIYQ